MRENTQPIRRKEGLDVIHLSLHGLIRGENLELGRDADTGGQCLYVLELVKALAQDERLRRVSLLTRSVVDARVSKDYSVPVENLQGGGEIVRIAAGPRRYLRKEVLWRHLDAFIDGVLGYLRREKRVPDVIHAHYADAGYVGRQVAAVIGCPFVFTGHSLGRVKRLKLDESGVSAEEIESRYNLAARIEAEEQSLEAASLVCTSTRQEVVEQYAMYHQYAESRLRVIPPGVDLSRFDGNGDPEIQASVESKIERFLKDAGKPPILAIARADERKNLSGLVRAFAGNAWLKKHANLVIVGGNRERLEKLSPGARRVWNELLREIDDGDLYGSVAVPKHHQSAEVAGFYRWAAARGGIFVNAAFTEPFGLTLLEASAAGLPLVATHDGGPNDILANCENGLLVDPFDEDAIGRAMEGLLQNPTRRDVLAKRGYDRVREHYSWKSHVGQYLKELQGILPVASGIRMNDSLRSLVQREKWVVMDILPDLDAQDPHLVRKWIDLFERDAFGFGIVTALTFEQIRNKIQENGLPEPGFVIAELGADIRYGQQGVKDERWQARLERESGWQRNTVMDALRGVDGLTLQEESSQHTYKISYLRDPAVAPSRAALQRLLRNAGLAVKVIVTAQTFLDVIPIRSGKDVALRYLEHRWGIDPGRIFYFANYGSDAAAVRGKNLSVVPSDADRVLRQIRSRPRIFHAPGRGLAGFFEGMSHYEFLGKGKPLVAEELPGQVEEVDAIELHP